jgi:hypothetical protein
VNDVILRKREYITWSKEQETGIGHDMGRLIKYLVYLVVLAGIGLVGYAYVGPWFGADFRAPSTEVRKPVVLNAD